MLAQPGPGGFDSRVSRFIERVTRSPLSFCLALQILIITFCSVCGVRLPGEGILDAGILPKAATYEGATVGITTVRDGRSQVDIDLTRRVTPAPVDVSGRIRLVVDGACILPPKATLRFTASIKVPKAYKNPGGFNYRDYLRRNGIGGQAFIPSCHLVDVIKTSTLWPWERFRQKLYTRLLKPDLKNGPILAALLIGTRTVGDDNAGLLRDFGLSHLIAISGMQFAVMVAIMYWLIGWATRPFASRLYRRVPRQKLAAAGALVFIAAYSLIVLPQPSVVRAAIMAATLLLTILLDRQKNLLHVLKLSAFLILIFRPTDLFDVSFQLSYLCVASLVLAAGPLWTWLSSIPKLKSLPKPLLAIAQILVATWALGFLLMPLTTFVFGSVSVNGFIHNLWGIPYFDFVITPISLVVLIIAAVSIPAAQPLIKVWDASVTLFIAVLKALSAFKLPLWQPFPPHLITLIIFYGGILAILLTRKKSVLAVVTTLFVLSLAITYRNENLISGVRVEQIDVGQGDSELIRTADKTVLIDAGGSPFFDIGRSVLVPFLRACWIDRIDIAIITHADTDHYLGFKSLIEDIPIGEFWINGRDGNDDTYKIFLADVRRRGIPVKIMRTGDTVILGANTTLAVLAPDESLPLPDNDNDHSLVLKLESPGFSEIFTGDISSRAEKQLIARDSASLKTAVLKVGHHGSASSTSEAWLHAVAPSIATIGVGEQSRFSHPHPNTLKRLETSGVKTYRTDLDGLIRINANTGTLSVATFTGTRWKWWF